MYNRHDPHRCSGNRRNLMHNSSYLYDYGPRPFVINIEKATLDNINYRTALWTGEYMQLTLMSINPREDVGLEVHPDTDQFFRVEQGQGVVEMGSSRDNLNFQRRVTASDVIVIPAGVWHNITNIGRVPLKMYSIYAPPHHPHGTVHVTQQDAIDAEENH